MLTITYKYRYKSSSIIIAIMLLCGGCSINNIGIGSHSETKLSNYSKIVTYEASGLHFYSTLGVGVQLGYIQQQFIYPVINDDQDLCLNQIINDTPHTASPSTELKYADNPIMINTQQAGLGLAISLKNARLNLGTSSQKMLSIHKQDSVSIYYLTAKKQDASICAVNNLTHNNRSKIDE